MFTDRPAEGVGSRRSAFRAGANNSGSNRLGPSVPGDGAVQPAGRKARRHARRQDRAEQAPPVPVVYEMAATSPDGAHAAHIGTREAVERVADDLRGAGWRVCWWPLVKAPAAKMFWRG